MQVTRRRIVAGGLVVVLACVVLAVVAAQQRAAVRQDAEWRAAVARVLDSRGALAPAVAFAGRPERLPAPYRAGAVVASAMRLDGARTLVVVPRARRRLLLVVACAGSDRSYAWTVRSRDGLVADGYGACGRFTDHEVFLSDGAPVTIAVVTRGVTPFAASAWLTALRP